MLYPEAVEVLRNWRETNERRSEDVLFLWKAYIELNLNKIGNEKHLILEQVCFAALDQHELDVLDLCIKLLSRDFPKSLRVQKFIAMRLEALERYDEALQKLDSIIKEDETNAFPRKRKVAIFKAQGNLYFLFNFVLLVLGTKSKLLMNYSSFVLEGFGAKPF